MEEGVGESFRKFRVAIKNSMKGDVELLNVDRAKGRLECPNAEEAFEGFIMGHCCDGDGFFGCAGAEC